MYHLYNLGIVLVTYRKRIMFFKKNKKTEILNAYITGKQISLTQVNDPVFSTGMMGDGIAIVPDTEMIVAPADGVIVSANPDMKHAIGLKFDNGVSALIHIGLETVNLKGEGFEVFVKQGQRVKKGSPLVKFDKQVLIANNLDNSVILALTDTSDRSYKIYDNDHAIADQTMIIKFDE